MENIFVQFPSEFDLVKNEEKIMKFHEEKEIYLKQRQQNLTNPKFQFLDGPPFCSGTLHTGHMLVSACKSALLNYKAMCGFNVQNKIGFDVHGVPSEGMCNRLLNLKTRQDVLNFGIDKYNAFCKKTINELSNSWEPMFKRIGRFVDYKNQYKTMDTAYMETCWWVIKQLWEKGLIYRGYKVLHFSTGMNTTISKQEASENYKDVVDITVFVKFKVVDETDLYFVAWTTTPWTLPSNLALCVNSNLDYCIVRDHESNHRFLIGKDALSNLYPVNKKKDYVQPYDILENDIKGSSLVGKEYEPLFPYFVEGRKFKVISATFVTAETGTGIVHMAPAFGEDDFRTCVEHGVVDIKTLGEFCPINEEGKFTDKVKDYSGLYFLDANKVIIKDLKNANKCVKILDYRHSYPFCSRTNTRLLYMAVKSFFIDVPKIRDQMVENNKTVNWIPVNVGSGRVHNWLENAEAWPISRSRIFGTPLLFFKSDNDEEIVCFGSREELCKAANLEYNLADIHLEFVKDITISSSKGNGPLRFVGDVLDCWFESACAPLAQIHYPFENEQTFDNRETLVDFVLESSDQTTNWFYVLNVISTALFNKPAFKNVICTGLILAEDGSKISKSKGNYVPPEIVFNEHGGDGLRLYLMSSPAAHAGTFKFVSKDIAEVNKKLLQLYNVHRFFLEHAITFNKEGFHFTCSDYEKSTNIMDKWILARIGTLISKIRNNMDNYLIYKVYPDIQDFIEDLANWYIKFNRIRMKGRDITREEQGACLSTCWNVLFAFSKLLAPFAPFLSETFYQQLKILLPVGQQKESVHLCKFPVANDFLKDPEIERKMSRLQHVSGMVRYLRTTSKNHTSVKMPIESISILVKDTEYVSDLKEIEKYLIEDVNAFSIQYGNLEGMVNYFVKPDDKIIGQKYRDKAKGIRAEILKLPSYIVEPFVNGLVDKLTVTLEGVEYELGRDALLPSSKMNYFPKEGEMVKFENSVMVICNFQCTEKVSKHYNKSLFIREVQDMRKTTNLHSWDKIGIYYRTDSIFLLNLLSEFHDEISKNLLYEIKHDDARHESEIIVSEKDCIIGQGRLHITICSL